MDGIKKLRENGATICYTTHYMEEVEMICDRVVILDKGKLLAQGSCDELKKLAKIEEKVTVEADNISDENLEHLRELKHVEDIKYDNGVLCIIYRAGTNNLTRLIDCLNSEGIVYRKIYSERPTLNDVFLELTGKELRD